jgi:hypothetical protein
MNAVSMRRPWIEGSSIAPAGITTVAVAAV